MNDEFITGIHPNNQVVAENPPRFTWHMKEEFVPYTVEISQDEKFEKNVTTYANLSYNFFVPDITFDEGTYHWRVNSSKEIYTFNIDEDELKNPVPKPENRFKKADNSHPRLWLNQEKIAAFKNNLNLDSNFSQFDEFYQNSVLNRVDLGFPSEPSRYPQDIRVVDLWRENYMTCQVALCYIRSLSIAGMLKQDNDLIQKAKSALIEIADWDYHLETGSTTRLYNDECAYRVGQALAYGYDWLYNELTNEEREIILNALYTRTKEVADYAIIQTKIHNFPYDSHAIRSLSMMIIPCCIAMLDFDKNDTKHKDAIKWLNYAIDYISTLYTPWGGADGGWAEGPAYWTTGTAFVTEAIHYVKNYLDINLFKRPFFQKTGDFIYHTNPPHTYFASFCDQSNQGDKPGPKTAFNMRLFAGITRNGHYKWYFDEVMKRSSMAPEHFSDKGWWDLYYDDMVFHHDFGKVAEKIPFSGTTVKHFTDVGWVAVNKNMAGPENHLFLLTKSSPYGSLSHSHADQNSFVLFAYGQPLIINSGHYVGYGTKMHLNWRKQTKSANTILIDGLGQYAGFDFDQHHQARNSTKDVQNITAGENKVKQLAAIGHVENVEINDERVIITMDATQAYKENVPYLEKYIRKVEYREDDVIAIVDEVALSQDGQITSLLHALKPFSIGHENFKLQVENIELLGRVSASSGIEKITQTDVFDGVSDDELVGLDKQYHLEIKTQKAMKHVITMELTVVKQN